MYDADGDRLIEISNLEQLDAVRYDLSDGDGRPDDDDNARDYRRAFPTSSGESVCVRACQGYELTVSLDFNDPDSYDAGAVNPEWDGGDGWLPINDEDSGLNTQFEGNGQTVSNLYIHRQDAQFVGLFARVGSSGVIRNLGVVNAEMQGGSYVGILAGENSGEITASHATGSVRGTSYYVGGLVGWNESGVIAASYASGSASGAANVGGLAGYNSRGAITASYATGSASASSGSVGGLVGSNVNGGAIIESYATGDVSGGGDSVGGLVGENSGAITVSYATGDVSGTGLYVGGLVGTNGGAVVAAYATGGVSGSRQQAGGLVGRNFATITASYAIGSVSGGGSFAGGLIGNNHPEGVITDSYWNTDIFGEGDVGTGKTTAQLQSPTGYTGIYRDWNADLDNADRNDDDATGADDFWDFGTGSQYPALKADIDGDGNATAAEFGRQGRDVLSAVVISSVTSGTGSLTVVWSEPSINASGVIAYDLRHIPSGDDETVDANWTVEEDVWTGSGPLRYVLTGLAGNTQYDVQVRAVNSVRDGAMVGHRHRNACGAGGHPLLLPGHGGSGRNGDGDHQCLQLRASWQSHGDAARRVRLYIKQPSGYPGHGGRRSDCQVQPAGECLLHLHRHRVQ